MGCTQARLCGMCPSWSLCRQLFLKLACKSPCSFQGLGILFYLDLRLAPLRHQKAFMTVKTRNEKCRPGISKAASCQAHRGSSLGPGAGFLPCLPGCSKVLDKVGAAEKEHLVQVEGGHARMLGSHEVSTSPGSVLPKPHTPWRMRPVGLCPIAVVMAGEGGRGLQALDAAGPGTALKFPNCSYGQDLSN